MSSNILEFKMPGTVRTAYVEPKDIFSNFESLELDLTKTLGRVGQMVKEHKLTVLNWLNYSDFQKPFSEWQPSTKEAMISQKLAFNARIASFGNLRGTLVGGEKVVLKRAEFCLRDITHQKQEIARIMGVVTEVLFLEAVVYHPDTLTFMSVEDYHIKSLEFK